MEGFLKELDNQLEEGVFPGYVLSICENNTFHQVEKGYQQLIPYKMTIDASFYYDLASLTKMLTSIILLQILEEKNISVTAKLHEILPAFKNDDVTLTHLFNHTAGLTGFIKNRNELSEEELRKELLQLAPQYQVGSKEVYSDHHYLLLGMVIEKLTEKTLEENLQKYINEKIGSAFTYYPAEDKCVPTIPLYKDTGEWVMNLKGIPHDPKAQIFHRQAGNAGVFGRREDLEKLVTALFSGKFLSQKNEDYLFLDSTSGLKRSLGFKLLEKDDGTFVFSHTGYTGTLIILDKGLKKGLIFLSNRVHPIDRRSAYIKKRDLFIKIYLSEV